MAEHTNLVDLASSLTEAWRSHVVGRPAGANFKVVRMDGQSKGTWLIKFGLRLAGGVCLVLLDVNFFLATGVSHL
jgi:hypothetical protein